MKIDLNRRGFLAASLASGAVMAGGSALAAGRAAGEGLPPRFTPLSRMDGTATPTDLCFAPAGMRPAAGPRAVAVAGRRLSLDTLGRAPQRRANVVLELAGNGADRALRAGDCDLALGQMHAADWRGVALTQVLDLSVADPDQSVLVHGLDGTVSLPVWKAADDVLLGLAMNDAPVNDWHGGPVRLVVPGWEGAMWMRGVRSLELSSDPWQPSVASGKVTDGLHPRRGGRWAHRLGVNSVITAPSRVQALSRGRTELTGLAWTGTGTVAAVDVSVDGGQHWQAARLDPSRNRGAIQRFRLTFQWDGGTMTLASRATDTSGATQPTGDSPLLASAWAAGRHVNAIQTWAVAPDGRVIPHSFQRGEA